MRFNETKVLKEDFYSKKNTTVNLFDLMLVIKLSQNVIRTKNNCKYLIGYSNEVIRPILLILPKMNGHVKTFKKPIKD